MGLSFISLSSFFLIFPPGYEDAMVGTGAAILDYL
jgi:hypothetical protein